MANKGQLTMSKLSDGEIASSSSGEEMKERYANGGVKPYSQNHSTSRSGKSVKSNNKDHYSRRERSPSEKNDYSRRERSPSEKHDYSPSRKRRHHSRRHSYSLERDTKPSRSTPPSRNENHKRESSRRKDPSSSGRKSRDNKHRSSRHDKKSTSTEQNDKNSQQRHHMKTTVEEVSSDNNLDHLLDQMTTNNSEDDETKLQKRREQRQQILEKYAQKSEIHQSNTSIIPDSSVMSSVSRNTNNKCTSSNNFEINYTNSNHVTIMNNDSMSLSLDDGLSIVVNNENTIPPTSTTTTTTTTSTVVEDVDDSSINLKTDDTTTQEEHIMSSEFLKKNNALNDSSAAMSFDMFAEELALESTNRASHFLPKLETTKMMDNNDDAEGYYKVTIGELMNSRYSVYAMAGKGVFSNVMRARDISTNNDNHQEVAIKMLRNNDLMKKQGLKELDILTKINNADPGGKHHCVQLYHHFKHRNHLCLVFEPLYINMRELVKKYGNGIGLNIKAVRTYSYQIFQALKHLKKLSVVHADIKPDNIMVNYQKNQLKLCDFGSACFGDEAEITPYLVSRFYRAPEIIMGLNYDYAIDLWSVGCSIFEMFTGKILFPARTNNEMLKRFMDLKGKLSHKMIRKSAVTLRYNHFDDNYNFIYNEYNPVAQKERVTLISNIQASGDLAGMLTRNQNLDIATKTKVMQLKDLLDKIFTLDPSKRITVGQSIVHSFIVDKCVI